MRFVLVFIFAVFCTLSYGQRFQNTQIDSLKVVAEQAENEQKADIYNQLSVLYRNTNTERALFYAKEALKISEDKGYKESQVKANINAGVILRNFGKSDEALNYLFTASKLAKEYNYPTLKADAYHKIGVTYLLVNDFENALKYAQQELVIWRSKKPSAGLADALNLMGLIEINLENYESAAQNLKESLKIGNSIGDTSQIYKPLVNLGDLYLKLNRPDSALVYIQKSEEVSQATGNTYGLAVASLKEGQALKELKNYKLAEEKIRIALLNAERLNSLSLVRNCYENLAQLFEESNKYKNALMYYKLYIATEDSMLNEVTRRKIAQIETEYKLKEKDSEIEQLKAIAGSQKFKFTITLFLLLALITFSYFLYKKVQKNRATKANISQLNTNLQSFKQENELLRKQQTQVVALSKLINSNGKEYLNFFSNHFISCFGDKDTNSLKFHLVDDSLYILAFSFSKKDNLATLKNIYFNQVLYSILNYNGKTALAPSPSDILKEIELKLPVFNQYFKVKEYKLGASVLKISINSKRVVFAGAGIPLYTIRHQNLHMVVGSETSLRSTFVTTEGFQNKTFQMNKHEQIFFFLENEESSFFTSENIRLILADHHPNKISETKKALDKGLEKWIPNLDSNSNALIFGLEV